MIYAITREAKKNASTFAKQYNASVPFIILKDKLNKKEKIDVKDTIYGYKDITIKTFLS